MKLTAPFSFLTLCSSVGVAKAWLTRSTTKMPLYQGRSIRNTGIGSVSSIGFSLRQSESSSWLRMSSEIDVPAQGSENMKKTTTPLPTSRVNGDGDDRSVLGVSRIPAIQYSTGPSTLSNSLVIAATVLCLTPDTAVAALTGPSPIVSAFAAYGHYLGLFGMVACLVTERQLLEKAPNISPVEEDQLTVTDAVYGLFALLVFGTGYIRAVGNLGKGFEFYAHEPWFWLKIAMAGVLASTSFFNTTKIIQRAVAKRNATVPSPVVPMSDALAARMRQICNAQLHGIALIPLAATLMARGVGYTDSIPWQAEAGLALVATLGLSFKYINEALTFDEKEA